LWALEEARTTEAYGRIPDTDPAMFDADTWDRS
jgi:hypothetical protein